MIRKYKYYTKEQVNQQLKLIYKRIKTKESVVRLDKDLDKKIAARLDFEYEAAVITINPKYALIDCFVHEYFHLIYFGHPEKEILRREEEFVSLLSNIQMENLLRRLSTLVRHKNIKMT